MFVNVELAANQTDNGVSGFVPANFVIGNGAALNTDSVGKFLLRKAVIAFAYKMYLDIYFAALKAEKTKD